MGKVDEVIEQIIAPAIEQLSRGVVVNNGYVDEMRFVGTLYQIVGDMEMRQHLLGLSAFTAPMLAPLTNVDVDELFNQANPRSLDHHFAAMRWAVAAISGGRGEVGRARDVLRATGCVSRGAVRMPALSLPAFAVWRSIGSYLIAPEYDFSYYFCWIANTTRSALSLVVRCTNIVVSQRI